MKAQFLFCFFFIVFVAADAWQAGKLLELLQLIVLTNPKYYLIYIQFINSFISFMFH